MERSQNHYERLAAYTQVPERFYLIVEWIFETHSLHTVIVRLILNPGWRLIDRYYFGGETDAMNAAAIRGFEVFLNRGRCVSWHTISQNYALFTDNRFQNLNVGFERIGKDVTELANAFSAAKATGTDVDIAVLTNKNTSELGRFAVDDEWTSMGGFKTPTLRNIEKTAPYMHDGSLKTLKDVVDLYTNGSRVKETDPVNAFQSGGIRPLDITGREESDLVAFMKALTSPDYASEGKKTQ